MEDVKEEVYPILQSRELYLPKRVIKSVRSSSLNHLKVSLREFERVFSDHRCECFDMIATYRPYHYNSSEFGLYLYAEMFCMLVLSILHRTKLTLREAHTLALDSILTHGSFHYLIERYTILSENALMQTLQIYPEYRREIYSQVWGTPFCYEETLANDYILKAHPHWSKSQKSIMEFYMTRQRDGYCQATQINQDVAYEVYDKLQIQLSGRRWNNPESCVPPIPKPSEKVPGLAEYMEVNLPFRYIGLPVYLVNDFTKSEDFMRVVELFFPQL